jgi:thiol-disulfide isomerase/thioredoxin
MMIFLVVLSIYPIYAPMTSGTASPAFSDEGFLLYATTQRVVLTELFTATWCGYCPYATQAINKLAEEYGSSRLVVLQYHTSDSDPFGNAETDARISYYGITGYPTMIFDGTTNTVGGWEGAYDSYNATIKSELQKSSDFSISLAGSLMDFTANVTASGSIQSTSAKVRFVVYEDDIPYNAPNGEKIFKYIVRTILNEQALTLASGQTVSMRRVFQPQTGWNMSNLGLVVFVQKDDTHEVLQAATFPKPTAFSFSSPATVRTVQPNETASFSTLLTNTGTLDDSYNLTLTKSLPAGWAAQFCNGTWCCPHSIIIAIQAGGSQNITIDVFTSNSSGSGKVTLDVTSQRDPTQTCSIVFDARVGSIQIKYISCNISDDPMHEGWGDGHGDLNPGETAQMALTLRNDGPLDAYSLVASLSTLDPYVLDFTSSSANYGTMAIGSSAESQPKYAYTIANWCPTPHPINFSLTIKDSEGNNCTDSFQIIVNQAWRKIAYIYSNNQTNGISFSSLLEANNLETSLIAQNALQDTNFSSYDAIIIGNDATDIPNSQAMVALNKPILGVGEGGYDFFRSLGLLMVNTTLTRSFQGTAQIPDCTNEIFNFPVQVPIPANQTLVVSSPCSSIQSYVPSSAANLTVIVTSGDSLNYSLVVQEANRFMLWGLSADESSLTDNGKMLFVNCLRYLLKAPFPISTTLTYKSGIGTTTLSGGYWYYPYSIELSSTPAESGLKLPPAKYGSPLYGAFSFGLGGDTKFNVMIDANSTGCLAYIDVNNDKDLTNDKVYSANHGNFFDFTNPPTLKVHYGDLQHNYTICPYYWGQNALNFAVWCYSEGTVVLEGATYKARVVDVDGNSLYNKSSSDYFVIDLNRDGALDCESQPPSEGFVWQNPFLINDQIYHVRSVSVAGDQVVIEKVSPTTSSQISCHLIDGRIASFTVGGSVTPPRPGSYVNLLYTYTDGTTIRSTSMVDSNGNFLDKPNIPRAGFWTIRASWSGDRSYQCASSSPLLAEAINPAGHNVAVLGVTTKTAIGAGFICNVTALVVDKGTYAETFNVTVYSKCAGNQTIIGTVQNLSLSAAESANLTFTWNTTGFACGNYTICAYAWPVPGETDAADNNLTSSIQVTIPGDINGDFNVTLADLVLLAKAYGSKPGDAKWNINSDIDGNNAVSLTDLVILATHYGQHYP